MKNKEATIIAAGTKIKGDLTLSSSLHIDGEIEGVIQSDNIVTIGLKGLVTGEIFAKTLVINGVFNGSVESDIIEIMPRGKVTGTLRYHELTIEKGGHFEGQTIVSSAPAEENTSNVLDIKEAEKIVKTSV